MSEKQEAIDAIVSEMRGFKRYATSDSSDCRYVAYWLYQTFADRIDAAVRREAESIERIIRDAVIDYSEQYVNAPSDDVERELKERAARANAWLVAHGFKEEHVVWSKEESPCL